MLSLIIPTGKRCSEGLSGLLHTCVGFVTAGVNDLSKPFETERFQPRKNLPFCAVWTPSSKLLIKLGLDRAKWYAHNPGMKIGYARVSTADQKLALQHDALTAAGCEVIHDDKLSGVSRNRPGLTAALAACKSGDVLAVWKLDRLGRSTSELLRMVEELNGRGVDFQVLSGKGAAIDTTRPEGKLILSVFAAIAEFERELTIERTREGVAAARRRGKRLGRPTLIDPDKLDLARRLIVEGRGRAEAARMIGVDPATLRRHLSK